MCVERCFMPRCFLSGRLDQLVGTFAGTRRDRECHLVKELCEAVGFVWRFWLGNLTGSNVDIMGPEKRDRVYTGGHPIGCDWKCGIPQNGSFHRGKNMINQYWQWEFWGELFKTSLEDGSSELRTWDLQIVPQTGSLCKRRRFALLHRQM